MQSQFPIPRPSSPDFLDCPSVVENRPFRSRISIRGFRLTASERRESNETNTPSESVVGIFRIFPKVELCRRTIDRGTSNGTCGWRCYVTLLRSLRHESRISHIPKVLKINPNSYKMCIYISFLCYFINRQISIFDSRIIMHIWMISNLNCKSRKKIN